MVWAHLGRCFPLNPTDLEARSVGEDWLVLGVAGDSPRGYGIWNVNGATGAVSPQNPQALDIEAYVQGDALSVIKLTPPSHGQVALQQDNSVVYTPDTDFHGLDAFSYKVFDGTVESNNIATVTISVNPVGDIPVGSGDSYSVPGEGELSVDATSGVLSNDIDPDGEGLTAELITNVISGTLTLNRNDGSFQYKHGESKATEDRFTYVARNGTGESGELTVIIAVIEDNDSPVALDDDYLVSEGGTLDIGAGEGVAANDTDTDGNRLTVTLVRDVSNGRLDFNPDGSFIYVHDGGETTDDGFTYRSHDGSVASNNVGTVTISVSGSNDSPVAVDDTYSVAAGETLEAEGSSSLLANDTDAEGDDLTVSLVGDVSSGTLILSGDGSFVYDHDGGPASNDRFTYSVSDGTGDSETANATITVTPEEETPQASDDKVIAGEDTVAIVEVLRNDSDVSSQCRQSVFPSALLPTPTPTPSPEPAPTLTPAPSPVSGSPEEAINLVWVHLGECILFNRAHLRAHPVQANWFVSSAGNAPTSYGLWKVEASTGAINPHDFLAREWDRYVRSGCDRQLLAVLITPTPVATPTPVPTRTPTPTPTPTPTQTPSPSPTPMPTPTPGPKIKSAADATATVWGHLVPCFRDVSRDNLDASLDPVKNLWIVVTNAGAGTDYGVWTVDAANAIITPSNRLAQSRNLLVRRGC